MAVSYLPNNGEIVFREPFPKLRYEPMKTLYIKVIVNGMTEEEYRTRDKSKIKAIEKEVMDYKKILNAKAICKDGILVFTEHTPQSDFLELVKEKRN